MIWFMLAAVLASFWAALLGNTAGLWAAHFMVIAVVMIFWPDGQ